MRQHLLPCPASLVVLKHLKNKIFIHTMAHVPVIQFFYVNNNEDEDDKTKVFFDHLFTSNGFTKSTSADAKALFNERLCPSFTQKETIYGAIGARYFTIYLVVDGVMTCIMSIDFDYDQNEDTEEVEKINYLSIPFYCCIPKSRKARLLVDKVKSFTKNVYLSVTDESQPFWEHIGAKYLKSEEKYKLGGTKRKRKGKTKRKRHFTLRFK